MVTNKDPLQTPVQYVKGVGPYLSSILEKREVQTVQDLFYYFPIRYLDHRRVDTIRSLAPGKQKCIRGKVVGTGIRPIGRNRKKRIFEMVVHDDTGVAIIVWFHFNEKYLKKTYPVGKKLFIAGDCQIFGNNKQFVHPDIEEWPQGGPLWGDDNGAGLSHPIVPVYPLTEGLYQKTVRKIISNALSNYLSHLEETPLSVRAEGKTKLSLGESIEKIHHPPADTDLNELNNLHSIWHQRVIYDELFFLQLGLGLKKRGLKKEKGAQFSISSGLYQRGLELLPFKLTNAQKRVLDEIGEDISKDEPMNRLLQGDVGCGKTLVAFLSALKAAEAGYQTALMAPTEILAEQHYRNLLPLANDLGVQISLLTRSTPKSERGKILSGLASGKILIALGTHALIQEGVEFSKLGFIVIDEQHRFGVLQRATLRNKSVASRLSLVARCSERHERRDTSDERRVVPHVLVMTATPIPRTLAMSVYGDLDVSIIDELPAGRKPITTYVFNEKMRPRAYDLVLRELKKGRQVYCVCPLIEESEKVDFKNAVNTEKNLKEIFPNHKVGLLHGKMPAAEKNGIMDRFKKKEIDILVSTTVIEVGIDVPNSTVMIVEQAERFGLSQLHQLRGRVGRGGEYSFCLLMAGYAIREETRYRLKVMEETNDGFKIAEEDLKIRGPGDFLGTRQSGLPEFRLAHLVRDGHLLNAARRRAFQIIEKDPDLEKEEHQLLRKILAQRWSGRLELGDIS